MKANTNVFTLNCKMLFNDNAQMQDHVRRMWACADSEIDQELLEYLEQALGSIAAEIRHRLDN